MTLRELFSGNVQTNLTAANWEEAIRLACDPLIRNGIVSSEYTEQVIKREQEWPTGLPIEPMGIAIPHATSHENICKAGVSAALFPNSVPFIEAGQSAAEGTKVNVGMVFVMAIPNAGEQVSLYRTLLKVFRSGERITEIIHSQDERAFMKQIESIEVREQG